MANSNQSIISSDVESRLEKYKTFRTTASLPLQWSLLTLLLQGVGAWSMRHGGKGMELRKKAKLIFVLMYVITSEYESSF